MLTAGAPTLAINIAGTGRGVGYDILKVAGSATLGGNFQLHFVNGFRPSSGQSFTIITAVGGRHRYVSAVNAEGTPATMSYEANAVTATVK